MLIPIAHEEQEVNRWPWITIGLIVVNVVVFLLTNGVVQRQETAIRTHIQAALKYAAEHPYLRQPPEFRQLIPARQTRADLSPTVMVAEQEQLNALMREYRAAAQHRLFRDYGYVPADPTFLGLLCSMFLHAGWMHLIGNMLFLWLAGTALEDRWGRLCFPALYLASGAVATVTHGLLDLRPTVPLVGASGAIAGLMGAFLVRFATTRIRFFYWFLIIRGTFKMPAFVALPLWVLEQFWMMHSGAAGVVAVWAHVGGFAFGVLAAGVIRATNLEAKFLAPAIQKKTTWNASDAVTTALEKLDHGDLFGGIQVLVNFLKVQPNNVDARAALVGAYAKKGDAAAAARESARLVSAYVVARDVEGALAAWTEHRRTYADTPVSMRSYLALAAEQEKRGRFADAMDLYRAGYNAWPDDELCPKALVSCGRLLLEELKDPVVAIEVLERAATHAKITIDLGNAAKGLLDAARRAGQAAPSIPASALDMPYAPAPAKAEAPLAETMLTLDDMDTPRPPADFPAADPRPVQPAPVLAPPPPPARPSMQEPPRIQPPPKPVAPVPPPRPKPAPSAPAAPMTPAPPPSSAGRWAGDMATTMVIKPSARPKRPDAEPELPLPSPAAPEIPDAPALPEVPAKRLAPVPVKATAMDTTGLRVLDRKGRAGQLPWKQITGVSVARIEDPTNDHPAEVVLDLLLSVKAEAANDTVQCLRLTPADLALPQLKEQPGLRGFQQFVATVLKVSGATAYPTREECLGLKGFAIYPDLASYAAAIVARVGEA